MRIVYPYNEILPLRKAHDAYIIRWCASLAEAGHEVFLLIGQGSLDRKDLFKFYKISPDNPLKIIYLPILRRQYALRLQANIVFFLFAQREIQKKKPDWVIVSVLKQASYHLKRKVKGCRYLYEVHQLRWYPSLKQFDEKWVKKERSILSLCDFITVTTQALKSILRKPPYALKNPIEKIALACDFSAIQSKPLSQTHVHLYYVGQLYLEQGVRFLLQAFEETEGVILNIIGGNSHEVDKLRAYCHAHHLSKKVYLHGFMETETLQEQIQNADAFITTFQEQDRMPFVAHTKLTEYLAWQRPIIAPHLEIVHEEVPKGVLTYEPGNLDSLKKALYQIQSKGVYESLLNEMKTLPHPTWKKRGCLFNEVLNKMHKTHQMMGT